MNEETFRQVLDGVAPGGRFSWFSYYQGKVR